MSLLTGYLITKPEKLIQKLVNKIKKIERKFDNEIAFKNKQLHGEILIKKVKEAPINPVNSTITSAIDPLLLKLTRKESQKTENKFVLDPQRVNTTNQFEKIMVNQVNEKEETIKLLNLFINEFNSLNEDERCIIYYFFYKGKTDFDIYDEILNCSKRTYYRNKSNAKTEFANNLHTASITDAFLRTKIRHIKHEE